MSTLPSALVLATTDTSLGAVVIGMILMGVLVLAALFLAALVSILRSENLSSGGKLLWILIVLFLQLIGPIAWFAFGRNMRLDTGPGR